jgi:hypothetical protein
MRGASHETQPRGMLILSGLAASIFLHGLLVTPLLWGGHRHRHQQPNIQGASAGQHAGSSSPESMLIVFEDDSRAIQVSSDYQDDPSKRFLLPHPPISPVAPPKIPTPKLALIDTQDDRTASEADGNQAGHSMLFGRYMGQISARVERAWVRPRSVPAESSFACRVQIKQDQHGNVQEVTLEKCTDDPQWQVSLVRAISAASPLPAPPDPAVFSNLLTMEFDSDPYVAGASDQGFEPLMRMGGGPALSPPKANSRSAPIPASVTRQTRPDGSVDLTIVGSRDHPP